MPNKFMLVLFLGSLTVLSYAQAPDTLWTRHYGYSAEDQAWQLKQTNDGGFIVVGQTGSPLSIYLLRTDANGDTIWTRSFDYTGIDIGRSVESLDDGGFILTGVSGESCLLIRTDSLGNELWHAFLDGSYGRAVRVTENSDFIVAGYREIDSYDDQLYIAKTNGSGELIWSKEYGGNGREIAWDIQETEDFGFVVLGWTAQRGSNYADIYLLKIDANGDSIWSKTYGNYSSDEGRSILIKDDGGFIIAGKIASYKAVISTDQNGDTLWIKTYYDGDLSIANSIASTTDGGYILAGMTFSNYLYSAFVMKINFAGDSLWSRIIEDPEQNLYLRSIVQTDDGGFVATGYYQMPNGYNDVFICKLAPDITGIENEAATFPDNITLHQNYPNPFNASTTISFELTEPGGIALTLYDLLGRKILILADRYFDVGIHDITFDAGELSSGVYFYNLKTGDINETKSMILLK